MFAVYVIALTSLVTVSHSAPLTCEELVQPFDPLHFHHLEGRRALIAGSLSNTSHLERFKSRDSASINFVNETNKLSFRRVFGFGDSCKYLLSNITLEGSSIIFDDLNKTLTFLYTSCQDCVVMRFEDESKKTLRLYLFSRRREVDQEEMEEFRAQAECLNMLQPVMMDPNKELCPEKTSSDPVPQTEERTEGQKT